MLISNQIGGVISERDYSVTEQFYVIQTFVEALNLPCVNRCETD